LANQIEKMKAVWECLSSGHIIPRSSHGLSAFNSKVFLFGGEHEPRTPVDSLLHVFDLKSRSWTSKQGRGGVAPPARVAHAQSVCGSRLWVFGGRQGELMHEDPLNDLWQCELSDESDEVEWTCVQTKGDAPEARSFHLMATVDSKLYIFGGCGKSGRLNDLHCLDTHTLLWGRLPSSPSLVPRGGASFAAVGRSLVVLGGFCGHELGDIHVFDVDAHTWREVQGKLLVPPRSVAATCVLDGKVCVYGGEVAPSAKGHQGAGNFLDQVVLYDPTNDSLEELSISSGPAARGWCAMATLDAQSAVLFGGLAGDDETPIRLGDLHSLTITLSHE